MFQLILAIHILAAAIFLGNLITTAFWKVRADRTGNLENMAMTSRAVLLADYVFTGPGISALLVSGILLTGFSGWERFQEPWLGVSLMLLLLTAFIWAGVMIPLQLRMARLAQEALFAGVLDPDYTRTSRRWSMFSGITTLLPIVILFLMVLRP